METALSTTQHKLLTPYSVSRNNSSLKTVKKNEFYTLKGHKLGIYDLVLLYYVNLMYLCACSNHSSHL